MNLYKFLSIALIYIIISEFYPLSPQDQISLEDKINLETKKLESIKMEITQRESEYRLNKQKEKSIFRELRIINESEKELNQKLKVLKLKMKKNEESLGKLNEEIKIINSAIDNQKGILEDRLKGLYKLGRHSYQKILLSSSSYSDFIYRYKLLKIVAAEDKLIINSFNDSINSLELKSDELEIVNDQLVNLSENLYKTKEDLKNKKIEKKELLDNIRKKEKITLKVLDELKEYEEDLTKLLNYLNDHKTKVLRGEEEKILYSNFGNFSQMKRKLKYPVNGKVILGFGKIKHSKFNIYTQHNGIDFKAEYGEDVKAVYGGTVVFAKWFKSYGNLVIIDHFGGYFTLYSHLSEIQVKQGTLVEEDAIIGKVGDTGSLKGPILYFELRYKNIPLNPMKWFSKRRK